MSTEPHDWPANLAYLISKLPTLLVVAGATLFPLFLWIQALRS